MNIIAASRTILWSMGLSVLVALAAPAVAQDDAADPPQQIRLSLNSVGPAAAGGCRLNFVVRNELPATLEKFVLETVLFDVDGRVATMTLFDFGRLPTMRPRVRQFDMADLGCDSIGEVLVNGIGTCEGEGLAPETCLEGLRLSTRTDIEVTG